MRCPLDSDCISYGWCVRYPFNICVIINHTTLREEVMVMQSGCSVNMCKNHWRLLLTTRSVHC